MVHSAIRMSLLSTTILVLTNLPTKSARLASHPRWPAALIAILCVCVCSALFEWDMCIQLQLTDVCTPDSCGGTSNTFKNFNQDVFCSGTDYLLDDFSAWMTSKRDAAQIGSNSLVHLFNGFKPSGVNAIGCTWKGTVSS